MNSKRIRLTACACLAALAAPHGARASVAAPRATPRQEAAAPAPQDADLARGRALLDAGDYKAAALAFKEVAGRRREDADVWHLLGVALVRGGDAKGARRAFETAVTLRPDFGRAHAGLALALLGAGKTRDAGRSAERALALDAGASDAHFVMAVLRLARDDAEGALEAAEAVLKINPEFAAAHLIRARALIGRRTARPAPPPPGKEERRQSRLAYAARLREAAGSLEKFLRLSPGAKDEALWRQQLEALRYYAQYADEQEEVSAARALYAANDDDTDAQFERATILSKPEPSITEEARQHRSSGRVVLRVVLDADGTVKHPLVLRAMPYGLTEQAIRAALAIKFKPARRGGQPVPQYVTLVYGFNFY